jgi:hypothetical protein
MNSVAVWSVLECFRNSCAKVSLANDYIPRWVSLVGSPCVNRNSLGEIAQSFCFFSSERFLFVSSDSKARMDSAVILDAGAWVRSRFQGCHVVHIEKLAQIWHKLLG